MKSKRSSLLIELSDRLLKLVQGERSKNTRKIVYLNAVALESQDEGDIAKQISSLLKHLPLRTEQVFASIPRSQITTRILVLPSTEPQEISRMVEFQVEKEIPFPKEKIIFDHHLIEITKEGYSKLLLVIAGGEVIHRYLDILKRSGLRPLSLFFSSQGLVSWFKITQGDKEKEHVSVLVDIDFLLTHVEFLHRGELYFTRSLNVGSQQLATGENAVQESFIQELHRTAAAFKKEFPSGEIHKIFLSGASKTFSTIQTLLASRFPYPVEGIDFKTHCPQVPKADDDMVQDYSFSSLVGFLLRDEKRINLIPPSEKKARQERVLRHSAIQLLGLLLGSFLLLGAMIGSTLHSRRASLFSLKEKLRAVEPAASQIESMKKQLDFLHIREMESKVTLELLRELYRVTPPEVSLTYLVIEPTRLSLRGGSKTLSTVFGFAKSLEGSPLFKSVRVKNATRRVLSEGEMTLFQIDAAVSLEGLEGMEKEGNS